MENKTNNNHSELVSQLLASVDCPICKDILRYPMNLDCGHCFCSTCLDYVRKHSSEESCPQCRASVSLKNATKVYELNEVCQILRKHIGLDPSNDSITSPYKPHTVVNPENWFKRSATSHTLSLKLGQPSEFEIESCTQKFLVSLKLQYDKPMCTITATDQTLNKMFDYKLVFFAYGSNKEVSGSFNDSFEHEVPIPDISNIAINSEVKASFSIHSFDMEEGIYLLSTSDEAQPNAFPGNKASISVDVEICPLTIGDVYYSPVYTYEGRRWQVLAEVGESSSEKDMLSRDNVVLSIRCNNDHCIPTIYDTHFTSPIDSTMVDWGHLFSDGTSTLSSRKHMCSIKEVYELGGSEDCIMFPFNVSFYTFDLSTKCISQSFSKVQPFPSPCSPTFSMVFDESCRQYYGHRVYGEVFDFYGERLQLFCHLGRDFPLVGDSIYDHSLEDFWFSTFIRTNNPNDRGRFVTYEMAFSLSQRPKNDPDKETIIFDKYTPYGFRSSSPNWGFPKAMKLSDFDAMLPDHELVLRCSINSFGSFPDQEPQAIVGPDYTTTIHIPESKFGRYFSPPVLFDGHPVQVLSNVSMDDGDVKLGVFFKYNGPTSTSDYNLDFNLVNHKNAEDSVTKKTSYKFQLGKSSWGFPSLYIGNLFDSNVGFVKNGFISIRVTISLS
ncbi:hypothetical protein P9112_009775 [Eukaryota sp. TZLM1-RC]